MSAAIAFLLLAACDTGAARQAANAIVAADNAGDLEGVLACYTPDAVLQPPGEDVVRGREAIKARYETLFTTFAPQIELRIDDVSAQGALAFVRGHNGGVLRPKAGGAPRTLDDNFVMLLQCDVDRWRISHLMWQPASKH